MTTLTGFLASVVVHSSAAAFSHFGLTLAPMNLDKAQPAAEHVVARTHAKPQKLAACPERLAAHPRYLDHT
jgi:hypothetical protein